jgi:hypothetical protein
MDDIEETLGHDLQIGCQRCRHTIDVDADHHSTPLIAAGGLSALWSNRPSPWLFGHYSARHDNQSKSIFGDNPSPSYSRLAEGKLRDHAHASTGEQLKQLPPPPEATLHLTSFIGVQHKSQTSGLLRGPGRRLQDGGPAVGDVYDVAVTVPVGNINRDGHIC